MIVLLAAATIGAATVILVLVVASANWGTTGVARSLQLIENRVGTRTAVASQLDARTRLLEPVLAGCRAVAVRISPSSTGDRISRGLDRAGNPAAWTPERFLTAKGVGMFALAGLGLLFGGLGLRGLLFGGVGALAGFYLPDLLLYNLAIKRTELVRKGLADALDMLTVCVEAGQGFDAALLQVARNVDGPIGGELARVLSEIQIGKSRAEAFAALGERTTAAEVKNFVSALVQADRMGLPISGVLREQTKEMRLVRRQRAEEQAQKVTVKILFPLLLCLFPALFIIIIGPGAIRIMDTFSGL
ncbi:MAG: type II secretion system F family protein [Dermatophilaceae bacterium]